MCPVSQENRAHYFLLGSKILHRLQLLISFLSLSSLCSFVISRLLMGPSFFHFLTWLKDNPILKTSQTYSAFFLITFLRLCQEARGSPITQLETVLSSGRHPDQSNHIFFHFVIAAICSRAFWMFGYRGKKVQGGYATEASSEKKQANLICAASI